MLTKILTTGNLWMVIFGEVKMSFSMLLWNDWPLKEWRFSAVSFSSSLKHTCEVLSGFILNQLPSNLFLSLNK